MKKFLLISGMTILWVNLIFTQTTVVHDLTMWTTGQHTLWDGNSVKYYGFGPGFLAPPIFPGPILYANEGDTIVVNVRNQSQRAPHTIHWHGLDVDQANDGVPSTSFVIYHLQDTNYTFIAPHPGTYLYHCHVASIIHVQMGMYGNVIIRPANGGNQVWTGGPSFDKEYNWLISEFDKSWHDNIPVHDSTDTAFVFFQVPPFEPDYFLINGLSRDQLSAPNTAISAKVGEKVYLRLSNVGFYMYKVSFPYSLDAQVISSDGRALPLALNQDTLWLSPGERYGVMLSPTEETEDSISVDFVNMNSYQSWDVEYVPLSVNDFVGIDPQIEDLGVSIFPNPNHGSFFIRYEQGDAIPIILELFDLQGRIVYEKVWYPLIQGNEIEIQTRSLASGTYIIKAHSAKARFVSKVNVFH